ncbi:MAG: archease [Candidatus Aenigmatarchaeota archaeon]
MEKFKFIDITSADVAFEAYGKDLNELFANSALAMFEVMINTSLVNKKIERFIEVNGYDLLSLMFNWLNELIFYVDTENLAFSEFEVNVDEKNFKLKAMCKGEKIDRNKHEVRTLVKACTYHKMKIWKENEIWKAIVILDI